MSHLDSAESRCGKLKGLEMIRLAFFSCVLLIAVSQQAIAARHALLIGCSDYKTQGDLHGSGVDVALLKETLATPRFGFGPDDLTVLSDADPTTKPPTYDNILAAFETVVAADWATDAEPDVLLIYMSGHGGQRESDTENDGMDEFFMPIDESDVILDDQIGYCLSELDRKGIHTWIVFDSCFSGTMTRGNPNETVKGISPQNKKMRTPILPGSNRDVGWELPNSNERSSVVAFYACQAYEPAIEDSTLDKSDGEPVPHGLFTYCLLQCLEQHRADRDSKLSYEDLRRGIIERYRALGRTWPTPFCEGNLTQEVLGFEKWPQATALRLENIDGNVSVAGGQLAGLTNNAILAVYEPKDRKQESPIGYLKVTRVTATTGEVESVAYSDIARPVPLGRFPNNATCRVVSQEIGELRIALTLNDMRGNKDGSILSAFREKSSDVLGIFRIDQNSGTQGWSLFIDETERLLVPNSVALAIGGKMPTVEELQRVPSVRYPTSIANRELADAVERDLRRVYNCQNLQRLAAAYGPSGSASHDIKLRVKKVNGDSSSDEIQAGDVLRVEVVNEGAYDASFAVFFISSKYRIASQVSDFIKPAKGVTRPTTLPLFEMTINEKMWGQNGLILVGIPQEGRVKHQLNYSGLDQQKLGDPVEMKRGFIPATPFERQLFQATFGNEKFRTGGSNEEPQMSIISWMVSEQLSAEVP